VQECAIVPVAKEIEQKPLGCRPSIPKSCFALMTTVLCPGIPSLSSCFQHSSKYSVVVVGHHAQISPSSPCGCSSPLAMLLGKWRGSTHSKDNVHKQPCVVCGSH
jgi:hypothetical protein